MTKLLLFDVSIYYFSHPVIDVVSPQAAEGLVKQYYSSIRDLLALLCIYSCLSVEDPTVATDLSNENFTMSECTGHLCTRIFLLFLFP